MIMPDGKEVFVVSLSKDEAIDLINKKVDNVIDNLSDITEMLDSGAYGAADRYIDMQVTTLIQAKMLIAEMINGRKE